MTNPYWMTGLRLAARRLALGLLMLVGVSVVVFTATQLLPGDAARAILGRAAMPEKLEALRHQLNLDLPSATQYWLWLSHFVRGDMGTSLANGLPVSELIFQRSVNSLTLLVLVLSAGVPIAILAGTAAAMRSGGKFDLGVSTISLAIAAVPEFIIGIGLIVLFSTVVFHWLPPVSLVKPGNSVFSRPAILVLPCLTLVIAIFPYIFRMIRASLVESLDSEYVELARIKGLSKLRIVFVHAMPNAISPAIQAIALTCAYLAGGVVLVEYVFGYPGIGQGLVNAVTARDLPTVQAIVVLLAAFYVAVNIVADSLTFLATPRLRTSIW